MDAWFPEIGGFSNSTEDSFDPTFKEKEKEEGDREIRPSQVYETMEIADEGNVEFYGTDRRFLGRRALEQREEIYDHIRKTKVISRVETDPDKSRVYIFWKNIDGETE
jgi:hypothetical protein